jgi:hypothetical protein
MYTGAGKSRHEYHFGNAAVQGRETGNTHENIGHHGEPGHTVHETISGDEQRLKLSVINTQSQSFACKISSNDE